MHARNDIRTATLQNCISYQETAAAFAKDSRYYRDEPYAERAAIVAQQHAREYYDAAWTRLERLIGVA
jgi:hypothetical protein